MEQRVMFITAATADLDAARRFYIDGLGWRPTLDVPDEVIFFQVAPGTILGFFLDTKFAADLGDPAETAPVPSGFTLAYNVSSPAEVDEILARAAELGGTIRKPGQRAAFGGYHGHFADPNGVLWEIAHNPGWAVDIDGIVHLA